MGVVFDDFQHQPQRTDPPGANCLCMGQRPVTHGRRGLGNPQTRAFRNIGIAIERPADRAFVSPRRSATSAMVTRCGRVGSAEIDACSPPVIP